MDREKTNIANFQQQKAQNDIFFAMNKKCKRTYNEDRVVIIQRKDFQLYGIFDGHGGDQVSDFCQAFFMKFFLNLKDDVFAQNNIKTVKKVFVGVINTIQHHVQANSDIFKDSGSTLNAILVMGDSLYCINLGDSRACGLRKKDSIVQQLSSDHKPYNPGEEAQLNKLKSTVVGDRVDGILAVSRAIGDCNIKMDRIPSVYKYSKSSFYMVNVASDGIYDILHNQELYDKSLQYMGHNFDKNPLQFLYDEYKTQFQDNISICMIIFKDAIQTK